MFKNYLLSILRNLKRKKAYSSINITGLSIGISAAILIFVIVLYEFSFDTYQPDYKHMYRAVLKVDEFGKTSYTPAMSYPLSSYLKQTFPEFKYCTIIDANFGTMDVLVTDKLGKSRRFEEENDVAYVGDDFLKIFQYNWLAGDKDTAFDKKNAVVLSASIANKYFSDENPIGQSFYMNNEVFIVTGLVKDPPRNTEFPLKILVSYSHLSDMRWSNNWTSLPANVQCIVTLKNGVDVVSLEKKINQEIQKRMNEDGEVYDLFLQPFSDVHFDTRFYSISNSTIEKEKLYALIIIGFLILLISCINYINLNIALLSKNTVEIGIRKVLGGSRLQIFLRFIMETGVITIIAIFLALFYLKILMPGIETVTGFSFESILNRPFEIVLFILSVFLFVVFLGGGYPALSMSQCSPMTAIKAKIGFNGLKSSFSLKKILIVFQFGVSQILIIATLVVLAQINFMINTDMGFNRQSIVEVSIPSQDSLALRTFKARLLSNSLIRNVSYSSTGTASQSLWRGTCDVGSGSEVIKLSPLIKFIDERFINTYGVKLIAGKNIRDDSHENKFLVNEQFVKKVGLQKNFDRIIGRQIKIWGISGTVCGVIRDFNPSSLHKKIDPMVLTPARKIFNQAGIKIASEDIPKTLEFIKQTWVTLFPDQLYGYGFLDQKVESFYHDDEKILTFLYVFSGLAIFLASLGLFGMMSFMTLNRTKEVGIRKALGASVPSILTLLSKDFLTYVFIANVISWPIAWYLMSRWLENYAYRINFGWGVFVLAGGFALFIALLTISVQAIKAALANPVESLRYE